MKFTVVYALTVATLLSASAHSHGSTPGQYRPLGRRDVSVSTFAPRRVGSKHQRMRRHRLASRGQDDYGSSKNKSKKGDNADSKSDGEELDSTPENHMSQEGNLKAMHDFVEHLKEMNADWQKAANEQLKNGQKASEFSDMYHPIKGNYYAGDLPGVANPSASKTSGDASQTPKNTDQYGSSGRDDWDNGKDDDDHNDDGSDDSKKDAKDEDDDNKQKTPKGKQHDYAPTKSWTPPQPQPQPQPTQPKAAPAPPKNKSPKTQQPPSSGNYGGGNDGGNDGGGNPGGGGSNDDWKQGQMTFYDVGLNACGWTDHEPDYIVALSESHFNSFGDSGNSNNNPVCGRKILIERDGKQAVARVTDQCPGCDYNDLDMSRALFNHFCDPDIGKTGMKWHFI